VERLFQKERYKEAVKQAKLYHKEESTPENHRLLERAYFLRARQLFRLGMHTAAVQVAEHLLEFGVSSSDWLPDLVELLLGLGCERAAAELQKQLGTRELNDQLAGIAADWALKDQKRGERGEPEVARDVKLVRAALERLQRGDEQGARTLLSGLPRSSPLSEWKFFIRGLAAFYRRDEETTRANWERLDPRRMAARIACRLRQIVAPRGAAHADPVLQKLERWAFGQPVIEPLWEVCQLAARQKWDEALERLAPLRQCLRRIDAELPSRLTGVLTGSVIREAVRLDAARAVRLASSFTNVAEPMAIDPNWNRFWALVWDGPHAEAAGAQAYWSRYVEDLSTVAVLSPRERALVQSLVWNRLAEIFLNRALTLRGAAAAGHGAPLAPTTFQADAEQASLDRNAAIACLENSLERSPRHLPTHRLLVEAHRRWGNWAKLELAATRLLAAFPDDLETLALLARHYRARDAPGPAFQMVEQARRLKPLDESLRDLEWTIRTDLARRHAIAWKWADGRAEFLAAEQLGLKRSSKFSYLASKAIFEATAGEVARSHQYLLEARDSVVERAPLFLALAIESIRYDMPENEQDRFNRLWEEELNRPSRSETAGAMAGLLEEFQSAEVEYRGRDQHVQRTAAYLARTTNLKYQRADIESACQFLALAPGQGKLLEALVTLGLEQFPDSALIQLRAADIELARGLARLRAHVARRHLERALELADSSADPSERALCPQIKALLSGLNELSKTSP
jgi:hypothetical protein